MTVQEFVNNLLQVPITRIGNKYIVEAIEIVLDTRGIKFYPKLCEITGSSSGAIEKAMRTAKDLGILSMDKDKYTEIFGATGVSTSEYVLKAADYYRRNYENKNADITNSN